MNKIFILLIVLLNSLSCFAEDEEKLPPLDPAYMGVHGMVLMNKSSTIYASHLPLAHKPHNVQLIYKLEVKDFPLIQTVRDADLVTVKPDKFNLQRLMRGEKLTINADVYLGHFAQDGMVVYEDMKLTFSKLLYVREMNDLVPASKMQEYDTITLRKNNRIYVHKIIFLTKTKLCHLE